MNSKLADFKKMVKGRKVAFIGIGVSNTPAVIYLKSLGAEVAAFDRADPGYIRQYLDRLKGYDVEIHLGNGYLDALHGFDYIFRTPVLRYDLPEIEEAVREGAVLTSEIEMFLDLCPAEVFGVTGSDGKTTTTNIISNILEASGYRCWMGGNTGMPLLDRIDEVREGDKVVLELSSFQLQTMKKSPDVAVITNISPNHLDIHKSMEEYVEAKKNICRYQNGKQKTIINYDNLITRSFAGKFEGRQIFFSVSGSDISEGVVLKGEDICRIDGHSAMPVPFMKKSDIFLKGMHNVENYLAAAAAVMEHVQPEKITETAKSFRGVEHRIEFVREASGVRYYNDSIGTSPTRTIASINAFDGKVILIAGGYDKNLPYEAMGKVIADKVKCLILSGKTAEKIKGALKDYSESTGEGANIPVIIRDNFDDTVGEACRRAENGDVVLFSPASASFDMFRNFEEKGNRFKELVNRLPIL